MTRSQFNYYRSSNKQSGASPLGKKELKSKRSLKSHFMDGLILIAIAAVFLYSLVVNSSPRVISHSWQYRSSSSYEVAAKSDMSGLLYKTKLTFDRAKLASELEKQFPEISDVSVELPLVSEQAVVRLAIADPQFFLNSNEQKYILDSDGVIVGPASGFTGVKNLPVLDDQSGIGDKPGQRILGTQEVAFISEVLSQSKRAGVNIASAALPQKAEELDIKAADKPFIVKFYLGGDAATQVGQFLAARHKFATDNTWPADYLDVRIAGKVYYK